MVWRSCAFCRSSSSRASYSSLANRLACDLIRRSTCISSFSTYFFFRRRHSRAHSRLRSCLARFWSSSPSQFSCWLPPPKLNDACIAPTPREGLKTGEPSAIELGTEADPSGCPWVSGCLFSTRSDCWSWGKDWVGAGTPGKEHGGGRSGPSYKLDRKPTLIESGRRRVKGEDSSFSEAEAEAEAGPEPEPEPEPKGRDSRLFPSSIIECSLSTRLRYWRLDLALVLGFGLPPTLEVCLTLPEDSLRSLSSSCSGGVRGNSWAPEGYSRSYLTYGDIGHRERLGKRL